MKASILSLALVAGLATAQSSSIPSCATGCIQKYTTGDGIAGCGQLDIKCICSNEDFLNGIACCLEDACDTAGQEAAVKYAKQICSTAGVTVPDQVTCNKDSSSSKSESASASASAASKGASSASASAASKTESGTVTGTATEATATGKSTASKTGSAAASGTTAESSGTATGSQTAASVTSTGAAVAGMDRLSGVLGAVAALLFAL